MGKSDMAQKAANVVDGALSSTPSTLRLGVLLLFLVALGAGFVEYMLWRIPSIVDRIPALAAYLEANAPEAVATFALPASARWTPTEIRVRPGEAIKVSVSGNAHLGFASIIDAAKDDKRPLYTWAGPDGERFLHKDEGDKRQELLIDPSARIGTLLGYLQPESASQPDLAGNARPEGIRTIGYGRTMRNDASETARLWLIVNDILLTNDDVAKQAYLRDPDSEGYEKRAQRWPEIVRDNYWDLWWDDNVGQFVIVVSGDSN